MAITPKDILGKNKNLDKRISFEKINLDNVTIDDLKYNGKNYTEYINLHSLLDVVSTCQVSDAYKTLSHRSGVIEEIKPINNLKSFGRIFTCETDQDDWGTITMAIDDAEDGDVLFIKVNGRDKAIWGELASTCAKNKGIKATVIHGYARDLDGLLYLDYPVYASGFRPNAGLALGLGTLGQDLDVDGVKVKNGDFFYGDETGCVVIPQELFAKVMQNALTVKVTESKIMDEINSGKTLAQIVGLR